MAHVHLVDDVRGCTCDDRSRLTMFVNGSTTQRYQYTGQGLRVRKWTSSTTSGNTHFVYNENAQLIGEYDNAGARTQEIIWLGNLPVGVIAGTAAVPVLHYIESDHLGTPRVIVEATRNVGLWRWNQTNDPFGESTPNQDPDGDATSFTFNLRFAGQYRDSESGWYYNVHRYYDPSIGRYLESDPIGLGGGISTYSYVGAAPLTAVDPLGLYAQPSNAPTAPGAPVVPSAAPAPGVPSSAGVGFGTGLLNACRAIVMNPVTIGLVAAVTPSSTSACDTTPPARPAGCYGSEEEWLKEGLNNSSTFGENRSSLQG